MRQVASLFLPHLAIERVRRQERRAPRPAEQPTALELPVDDDPGKCSVPRGGGWRPGAHWARSEIEQRIAALPKHQRPSVRELGRRSEAAEQPFRRRRHQDAVGLTPELPDSPVDVPLVLVRQVGRRQQVTASSATAQALGVPVGMAATHARALIPGLDVRPHDLTADANFLGRLALHAVRHWTPTAAENGCDGLWLDLTGAAHLHGGVERFCTRLQRFLARAGYSSRIGVADTPGAAHALARFGEDAITIAPRGWVLDLLWPLPVAALRLDEDVRAACRRFGFERIGDLLPVARGPLARRLGSGAVERLDQALGRVAEPIVPITDEQPPEAECRLLEPIGTAESIAIVVGDLARTLCATMAGRGLGARALRLVGFRIDGGEQAIVFGTSRATRDPAHLTRLFGFKLSTIEPGFGIEHFTLTALHTEPLNATTIAGVLTGEPHARDVGVLVDRIAGRVGMRGVFRIAPVDSHVPERALRRCDALEEPLTFPCWQRPARLLRRPEPLDKVVALLPDHPPRRFTWRGNTHAIVAGDGPERVHGEWWHRDGELWGCRDYFRVEDDRGRRFWVFRRGDGVAPVTGDLSWHLHGVFG